jgi:hypothetical protein
MESEQVSTLQREMRIKKRLMSFENTFQKRAEICHSCYALNIWALQKNKPMHCHRCGKLI